MSLERLIYLNNNLIELPYNKKTLRLIYEELLLDTIYICSYFCLSICFFIYRCIVYHWLILLMIGYIYYELMY